MLSVRKYLLRNAQTCITRGQLKNSEQNNRSRTEELELVKEDNGTVHVCSGRGGEVGGGDDGGGGTTGSDSE